MGLLVSSYTTTSPANALEQRNQDKHKSDQAISTVTVM